MKSSEYTNKILNIEAEKFLSMLPDDKIQLTVTSPPYDSLRSYNSEFDLEIICSQLLRATAPGGVCVWVVADQTKNFSESGTSFRTALLFMEKGWCLYDTMIWRKKNFMPGHFERYADEFEFMFVFSKGKPNTFNPIKIPCKTFGKTQTYSHRPKESKIWIKKGFPKSRKTLPTRIKGNVWEYATGKGGSSSDPIAFQHPAIFPEKLVSDQIQSWSSVNDLICDPFSGSATTAKVSYLMNRRFTGSEISKEYWKLGNKRLNQYTSQKILDL